MVYTNSSILILNLLVKIVTKHECFRFKISRNIVPYTMFRKIILIVNTPYRRLFSQTKPYRLNFLNFHIHIHYTGGPKVSLHTLALIARSLSAQSK